MFKQIDGICQSKATRSTFMYNIAHIQPRNGMELNGTKIERNARKFNGMNITNQPNPAIVLSKSTTMQFQIGKFILREPFTVRANAFYFHTHARTKCD